jgi:hypothetical protein
MEFCGYLIAGFEWRSRGRPLPSLTAVSMAGGIGAFPAEPSDGYFVMWPEAEQKQ